METGSLDRGWVRRASVGSLVPAIVAGWAGWVGAAAAEPDPIELWNVPAVVSDTSSPDASPLALVIAGDDGGLEGEALCAAIAHEIGGPVVLGDGVAGARGVLTVAFRSARGELAVSYRDPR